MNFDPSVLSNFLLAFTILAGTLTAKYSSQSRAQRRLIRRLRLENEALWEDRYAHRRVMAINGVPYPDPHPTLKKLEQEEDEE